MKKTYLLIAVSLLLSLFIYLFYRTENTVVNRMFISVFSFEDLAALRKCVTTLFPLSEHIVYSLPEGLWVFSITLTSRLFFVRLGRREVGLVFLPLLFSVGLECMQLLHITNGRFDWWDIGASLLSWAAARYMVPMKGHRQNLLQSYNLHSGICLSSYFIVYLAHVWK